MTWNVEGLNSVLAIAPTLRLQDYDILFFTETLTTNDTEIANFHSIHSPAKKRRQRPPSRRTELLRKTTLTAT